MAEKTELAGDSRRDVGLLGRHEESSEEEDSSGETEETITSKSEGDDNEVEMEVEGNTR